MQAHGGVKDIQGAMRHARPDITASVYMQEIPEGVRRAVDSWDAALIEQPAQDSSLPSSSSNRSGTVRREEISTG